MSESAQRYVYRKLKWTVNNVTKEELEDANFKFISKTIEVDFGVIKTNWQFKLSHYENKGNKSLAFGLRLVSGKKSDNFQYSCSIEMEHVLVRRHHLSSIDFRVFFKQIPLIKLETLLNDSQSYIKNDSEMEFVIDIAVLRCDPSSKKRTYSHLYEDPTFADFTLIPSDEEKEFKIHRTVLAYESDFFMKLFTTDMKEKQNGSAKFDDIDSTTLEEVVKYVYKGEADLEDVGDASEILYAAEKFNLAGLKLMCIKFLEKKVRTGNAIEILAIAEPFSIERLEDVCLHEIIESYQFMKDTGELKTIPTPILMKIMDAFNSAYNSHIPHHVSTSTAEDSANSDDD